MVSGEVWYGLSIFVLVEDDVIFTMMNLTKSKLHAISSGLIACALGCVAIKVGDHHAELSLKVLVAMGVVLVMSGLFLLRYSWTLHERR